MRNVKVEFLIESKLYSHLNTKFLQSHIIESLVKEFNLDYEIIEEDKVLSVTGTIPLVDLFRCGQYIRTIELSGNDVDTKIDINE